MKSKFFYITFIFAIVVTCAGSGSAQTGKVIEVLDGKTMLVALDNGSIKIQLDYIDVPEVGQPLNETVRSHLQKLVLGKVVQFRTRLISTGYTISQVTLNDVDISQQLIRDGAAWHLPIRLSGQLPSDHATFQAIQDAAKKDRLGIWAVPNIKPAWEYRDEISYGRTANASNSKSEPTAVRRAEKPRGKWSDVNPKLGNVGPIYNGYNAESKTGFLSTGISMVNLNNAAFDERFQNAKLYVDITYWYKEESSGRKGTFVLTLISENDVAMFRRNQEMLLIIDNGRIAVGRGHRLESRSGGKVFEKLTFNISRSNMQHMANDVTVMKIADQVLQPQSIRYILLNMLQFST